MIACFPRETKSIPAEFSPARTGTISNPWPFQALETDPAFHLRKWAKAGKRIAISTLAGGAGALPRPPGSALYVNEDGESVGFIAEGCLEAALIAEARRVIVTGKPSLLAYGSGSPFMDFQLPPDTRLEIFCHEISDPEEYAGWLERPGHTRTPLWLQTDLATGETRPVPPADPFPPGHFRNPTMPPLRLTLLGGGPATLQTALLALQSGLEVHLLRPLGPRTSPFNPQIWGGRFFYHREPLDQPLITKLSDSHSGFCALDQENDPEHEALLRALSPDIFTAGFSKASGKIFSENPGPEDPRYLAIRVLHEFLRHVPAPPSPLRSSA